MTHYHPVLYSLDNLFYTLSFFLSFFLFILNRKNEQTFVRNLSKRLIYQASLQQRNVGYFFDCNSTRTNANQYKWYRRRNQGWDNEITIINERKLSGNLLSPNVDLLYPPFAFHLLIYRNGNKHLHAKQLTIFVNK